MAGAQPGLLGSFPKSRRRAKTRGQEWARGWQLRHLVSVHRFGGAPCPESCWAVGSCGDAGHIVPQFPQQVETWGGGGDDFT